MITSQQLYKSKNSVSNLCVTLWATNGLKNTKYLSSAVHLSEVFLAHNGDPYGKNVVDKYNVMPGNTR